MICINMSGGSYNYLCYKDASEISNNESDIKDMVNRLSELNYPDAAKETESVLLEIRSFEVRMDARLERLSKVWKSVEWLDSGDSGEEGVRSAIEEYRE